MKLTRILGLTATVAIAAAACSGSASTTAPPSASAPAASANTSGTASDYTAPTDGGAAKGKTIAIISTGEQHQFWQAV